MQAPLFWNKQNYLSKLLFPLGCLYAGITALRLKIHRPVRVNVPVICIGNLTAGGSGKTPTAISIAEILQRAGFNPGFITRGYGGKLQNVIVNPATHSAADVGDEPLLLAKQAPVAVNHRRDQAAQLSITNGADIIIMDDGFQNPSLYKDKSVLVIDGAVGLGNCYPIPAGPLREFFSSGIKRADALIILGEDIHHIAQLSPQLPVFKGKVAPKTQKLKFSKKVLAFAGIGRPDKFFNSLKDCGADIIKTYSFPDHHFYTEDELKSLIQEALDHDADIFTTSKDMVKIPPYLQPHFHQLEITIVWENENALKEFLLK